jgi:hypothetical protein
LVERGGFSADDPWYWPIVSRSGLLAGFGTDGFGRVVDVASGEVVLQLGNDCGYFPVAIDDAGKRVLIGAAEGCAIETTGRVLDLQTGAALVEFDAPPPPWSGGPPLPTGELGLPSPLTGAFGPAGTLAEDLVLLNRGFELIELIDTTDGSVVGSMDWPEATFVPLFSPDGRYVSWGSQTYSSLGRQSGIATAVDVQAVLDGASMDEAIVFEQPVEGGPFLTVHVSDGLVATSHFNERIRLWELDSGEAVMDLPVETVSTVVSARFSDDGRYLWYTSGQGELHRMPMDPEELVALARERTLRGFTADECERFLLDEECAAEEGTE